MPNSPWQPRIITANKYFSDWEAKFKCKVLDRYVEGFQWRNVSGAYLPYTLNLIHSTIKIKLANILFQSPQFIITAKPQFQNWNPEFAQMGAQLKGDTINTLIGNPNVNFVDNSKLVALDSFTRFGVMEIGYGADWSNPNKIPALTQKYDNPDATNPDGKLGIDEEVPINERVFFKHIRANRFRVSANDSFNLYNCAWCGYYEWVPREVLEATPGIKLDKDYSQSYTTPDVGGFIHHMGNTEGPSTYWKTVYNTEILKIWIIWDNYLKKKLLLLDGSFEIIWEGDFERLPFTDLRWDPRQPSVKDAGWYPVPLVWHWLSPQDEINRAREQMRRYRNRFTRKFQYPPDFDPVELDKFTNEIDGEMIEIPSGSAGIQPINNPEIGVSIAEALNVSLNDINIITGTSAPARQSADRETATSARITDMRQQVRESVEQLDFSKFLTGMAREALLKFQENFAQGIWVKMTKDPPEEFLGEIQQMQEVYNYVTAQMVNDGYDMDIDIAVTNATPARMLEQQEKFLAFMGIVKAYPEISLSPKLVREAANISGYRNDSVVREMQKMAEVNFLGAGGPEAVAEPGNEAANDVNSQVANANPNPTEEITAQLEGQLG